jgi:hypothetical protein
MEVHRLVLGLSNTVITCVFKNILFCQQLAFKDDDVAAFLYQGAPSICREIDVASRPAPRQQKYYNSTRSTPVLIVNCKNLVF